MAISVRDQGSVVSVLDNQHNEESAGDVFAFRSFYT